MLSVPGPVPSASYALAPLILSITLCDEYCPYPHLADQETEAREVHYLATVIAQDLNPVLLCVFPTRPEASASAMLQPAG